MATATRSHYATNTCKYPGCTRPRYKEPAGYTHEFCGRTHANMYTQHYGAAYLAPAPTSSTYNKSSQKTKTTPGSTTSSSSSTSRSKPMKGLHNIFSKKDPKEIKFYNSYEPYYEFTNFYRCGILVDGKYWPTSEHYFQAQKFVGTPYVEKIRKLASAREAFQLSRDPSVSRWIRSDWDQVKDDIMLKALRCKFDQDESLRDKLLETRDKKLIEHTENDSYWGDGGGTGLNKLGTLLMQVQGELRSKYGDDTKAKQKSPYKRSSSFSSPTTRSKYKHSDDMVLTTEQTTSFPPLRRSGSLSNLTTQSSSSAATFYGVTNVPYSSANRPTYASATKAKHFSADKRPPLGTSHTNGAGRHSSVDKRSPPTLSGHNSSHKHTTPRRSNDSSQIKGIFGGYN